MRSLVFSSLSLSVSLSLSLRTVVRVKIKKGIDRRLGGLFFPYNLLGRKISNLAFFFQMFISKMILRLTN